MGNARAPRGREIHFEPRSARLGFYVMAIGCLAACLDEATQPAGTEEGAAYADVDASGERDAAAEVPRATDRPPMESADAQSVSTAGGGCDGTLAAPATCRDAAAPGSSCGPDACDAGLAGDASGVPALVAERDARSPDASVAADGGDEACRARYEACTRASLSSAELARCGELAKSCGFAGLEGISLACSLEFAACVVTDLTGYQRCIDAALACRDADAPP
jgi:hypothetical protein